MPGSAWINGRLGRVVDLQGDVPSPKRRRSIFVMWLDHFVQAQVFRLQDLAAAESQ